MAKVLVIDNYDSFTYNLVQYLRVLGAECEVVRNDRATVDQLVALDPSGVLLSPGPGDPEDAGITLSALARFAGFRPVLGVCLGHQAIAHHYGARVSQAPAPVHGKASAIEHDGRTVFRGVPSPTTVARYHSLAVDSDTVPSTLEVSARTPDGVIMGLRHRVLNVEGVQFHPESILTRDGLTLLGNWLGAL